MNIQQLRKSTIKKLIIYKDHFVHIMYVMYINGFSLNITGKRIFNNSS